MKKIIVALALVIASCLPVITTVQAFTTNVTKNTITTSASVELTNDCYPNCVITYEDGCIVITKTIVQNGNKIVDKIIITDQYKNIIYKILMQEKNKCLSQ